MSRAASLYFSRPSSSVRFRQRESSAVLVCVCDRAPTLGLASVNNLALCFARAVSNHCGSCAADSHVYSATRFWASVLMASTSEGSCVSLCCVPLRHRVFAKSCTFESQKFGFHWTLDSPIRAALQLHIIACMYGRASAKFRCGSAHVPDGDCRRVLCNAQFLTAHVSRY